MKLHGYLTDMEDGFNDYYTKSLSKPELVAYVRDEVFGGLYDQDSLIKNFILVLANLIFQNEDFKKEKGLEYPELFFVVNTNQDGVDITVENVFEGTCTVIKAINTYSDVQKIVLASAVYEKLVLNSIDGITNNLLYNMVFVKPKSQVGGNNES